MLRNACRARLRGNAIPRGHWNVARVLMVFRGGEPTAALTYLQTTGRGKDGAALGRHAVDESIREWWDTASEATKRDIVDVVEPTARKKWAVAKARRFLAECDLEVWVGSQNHTKGISRMSSLVLVKAKRELERAGAATARTRKGCFQWPRRWRRRWGVRLRKLPALEKATDEEVRQKAIVSSQLGAGRN